jgi:hypothetical protein
MAITLTKSPQRVSPGCNPYEWNFTSTQAAQPNFSFIVELYINGVYHSTHETFLETVDGGKFNAEWVLRSYLNSNLITDGALLTNYFEAFAKVSIKVFEKYGTPPALAASVTAPNLIAINAALNHVDFINWDYRNYDASRSNPFTAFPNTADFLTYWPRSKKAFVGLDQRAFLGLLSLAKNIDFVFTLYDLFGAVVTTDTINILTNELVVIDCSPATIVANTAITIFEFDDSAYYTVQAQGLGVGTNTGFSEEFTFWLDFDCKRYPIRRLHWLNKFGVWDSFSFEMDSVESAEVTAQDYERNKGAWIEGAHTHPIYQGQNVTASKQSKAQMLLNSDWIAAEVQQWLVASLFESPKVYLETPSGFEPVKVANTSYQLKTRKRNGLIQEQVTLERTYTYQSQLN